MTLHRTTAKIIVLPMTHESHGRATHRTWVAGLARRDADDVETLCPHVTRGHRTTEAAVRCGRAMWERLDA